MGVGWLVLLLTLGLFSVPAWAAIALRQSANNTAENSTSISATFTAAPLENNLLVAIAGNRTATDPPSTPAGWTLLEDGAGNAPGQLIYYRIAGAAEPVTVSLGPYSGASNRGLHIYEYSGVDPTSPLDGSRQVTGTGTGLLMESLTTSGDGALIIVGFTTLANTSFSGWTNGFSEQNDFNNGGASASRSTYAGAHLLAGAAGDYSASATTGTAGDWMGQAAVFNLAPPPLTAYTVIHTGDSGPGSLRAALDFANLNPDVTISFDIPSTDPGYQTDGSDHWWRITPATGLPAITESGTVVDGSTQTLNQGDVNSRGPEIEIHGVSAGVVDGLVVSSAANVVLRDLVINNFDGNGIQINGIGAVGCGVYGCLIGTDAVGESALSMTSNGVWVTNGASDTDIGGPVAGDGNLISGSIGGVVVDSGSTIRIRGNKIGVNRSGTAAIGNSQGILVSGTSTIVTIGGPEAGAGNQVAGNGSQISVEGSASSVTMFGNIIGTDPSGTLDLSGGRGIELNSSADPSGIGIGGLMPGEGNLIAFNTTGIMVWWNGGGHRIRGNTIRDSSGGGMAVYAPDTEIAGNTILGNSSQGIYLATGATQILVIHNTIHGNGSSGVEIATDASGGLHNNVITGNATYGLFMSGGTLSSDSHNLITDNVTNPSNGTRCNVALDATDLNADPLYLAPGSGDFSLTECTSPAINAGTDFGGAQPDMNGAEPGNYNGVAPDMGAVESGCSALGVTISGLVFEDADFAGTASPFDGGVGDFVLANVDVELYDAADGYLTSAVTDAGGNYSFAGLADGTYKVRVRSATIGDADTPPAGGLNASVPVVWPYPVPELAWADGAPLYGGQLATVDDSDTGDDLGPGDNWVAVTVSGVNASGVNFGFAYNLIVNTEDDGSADATRSDQGSLRQFLKNANAIGTAGSTTANSSEFRMQMAANGSDGGDTWWRISLLVPLPVLVDPGTTVDGSTQTTNGGQSNSRGPEIQIDGAAIDDTYGFKLTSADNLIHGLVINGFATPTGCGVLVEGLTATGNGISGCYIGTNAVGDTEVTNYSGIWLLTGPSGTIIGGSDAGDGNLLSGNTSYGIKMEDAGPSTTIRGNRIGTNATGDAEIDNSQGIYLDGGTDVVIGGAGADEGNLISGNVLFGVNLVSASDVTIQGNWIGLNLAGTAPLPNGASAIYGAGPTNNVTIGGPAPGEGNILAGNDGSGISTGQGCNNLVIQGNIIGTGPLGTETNLGNAGVGNVRISVNDITINAKIGGENPGEGNLIAHGAGPGITCSSLGSAVEIIGNVIRDNAEEGIVARVDSLTVALNVIHDNGAGFDGILLMDVASDGKIHHNTIHGNGDDGIEIVGLGHEIRNNIITGNAGYGINVNAGTMTESNNLITGSATSPANVLGAANVLLDVGDIDADPLFVGAVGGDFSLTECTSPAINTGLDLGLDQPDVNGVDPGLFTGPTPDMGALESSCVAASITISGRVFEDIAGDVLSDGVIGDINNPGAPGVAVYLYRDDGNTVFDGGDTIIAGPLATGASGGYSFGGLTDDTYFVRVDSRTIPSAQDPAAPVGDLWAVQTYASAGGWCANGGGSAILQGTSGPCYGGTTGIMSDSSSLPLHYIRVIISGSSASNIDLGFSFNVVVNSRGGDGADDDGTANRTVQGSLRQFLQNANAIDGPNVMRFVPVDPANDSTWWEIAVTNALPTVIDAGTAIDGSAFDLVDGIAIRNANADGPEMELDGSGAPAGVDGLILSGGTGAVRALAIGGFPDNGIELSSGANIVTDCYVGLEATGTSALANAGSGIVVRGTASGNTIGGASGRNIISGNVFDGIKINSPSANSNIISGNFIGTDHTGLAGVPNGGWGVSINANSTGNMIGGSVDGEGNTIAFNIQDGIWIEGLDTDRHTILGNSIFENGGLGIDIDPNGPGATNGANNDKNPPTISSVTQSGADFTAVATVAGGDMVEFFRAGNGVFPTVDTDPSGFGEGFIFLGRCVDNGGAATGPHIGLVADTDPAVGVIEVTLLSTGVSLDDWISATATDGVNGTSEFSANLVAGMAASYGISGIVFEDVDFAGVASDFDGGTGDLVLSNVDVELYNGSDGYVASTTTAPDGSFNFTSLPDGIFKVRARSATIGDADTPAAGGLHPTVPGTWPYPLAEMSWGNGAGLIGGQDQAIDDTATGDNAGPGDTWVSVTVSGGSVTGVNLGFNYDLITNGDDDMELDNARSKQGSLRQFIKNSNAIVGVSKSWFQIP